MRKLLLVLFAVSVLVPNATIARADVIADMFGAVDISTLATSISTLMIAFIAVWCLVCGFMLVKRVLSSVSDDDDGVYKQEIRDILEARKLRRQSESFDHE